MHRSSLVSSLALGLVVSVAGCDGSSSPVDAGNTQPDAQSLPDGSAPPDAGRAAAPPLYTPSTLGDMELATEALRLMGSRHAGGSGSCTECHGITRRQVRTWADRTTAVLRTCLTDLDVRTDVGAERMVRCLRGDGPTYAAEDSGIFSIAAHLGWFRYVFEHGAGADWEQEHQDFVDFAGMPAEERPRLTQPEVDIIASWFARDIPHVNDILPEDVVPGACEPSVSPDVATHAARMASMGWAARNLEAALPMHGCAGAATTRDCLSTEVRARDTAYGAGWDHVEGSTHRVLFTTTYQSSFWTRSSADGRFVAHGPGYVIDLSRDAVIPISAPYDPGFFPDNSAFVWPGRVCRQSLLTRAPTSIDLNEPECDGVGIGLYEHVGVGLGGGDYWVVTGEFSSDDGGHSATHQDTPAAFSADSRQSLLRMVNDGAGFREGGSASAPTPNEGDGTISPSSELLLTRMAGMSGAPIGYHLYRVRRTDRAGGGFDIALDDLATYCVPGNKVGFSYDERYVVYHHYIGDADAMELGFTGPTDPAFAAYRSQGAANVYLLDLTTGESRRITDMAPGQYALFPHFRSDGWIYFEVRIPGEAGEHVVASDAALVIRGG